jgi:serine/threonine-protein kinase
MEGIDRCGDVKLLRSLIPPPEDPAARARVDDLRNRLSSTRALFYSGRIKDADKLSVELVADVRRQGHAPVLAEAMALRGRILAELGSKDSIPALEEAVWTAEAARHDEIKAEAAIGLIYTTASFQAQYAVAENWGRLSEATLNRIGGHDRHRVWLEKHMGALYEQQGRTEEALARYKAALAIGEKALRPDDPDLMRLEDEMGIVLTDMGRPAEALGHNERALEIGRRVFGADHPVIAPFLSNRAEVLNGLYRGREARESASRAISIWEKQLPKDHLFFGYPLTAIGQSYLREGKPASAVAPLERALEIRRAKDVPLRVGETTFALARALWDSGQDHARARSLAIEARDAYATLPTLKKEQETVSRWLSDHPVRAMGR